MSSLEEALGGNEGIQERILSMNIAQLKNETQQNKSDISRLRSEYNTLSVSQKRESERIAENMEKIKLNKQLPYLVGHVVEKLSPADLAATQTAEETADDDDEPLKEAMVIKTSTRQTIFLPVVGLVDPEKLRPGDLVGVNKDSYLVLDTLPPEYDSRVKAMEVDEKPTEQYSDIGGLDKQITELIEAVVLPITHAERFERLGIVPPKGVMV